MHGPCIELTMNIPSSQALLLGGFGPTQFKSHHIKDCRAVGKCFLFALSFDYSRTMSERNKQQKGQGKKTVNVNMSFFRDEDKEE